MKKAILHQIICLLAASLLLTSFHFIPAVFNENPPVPANEDQPQGTVFISGSFEYSNEFVVETYYTDHAVALIDMSGFILRDKEWELPVDGQVLGYMDLDEEANRADFQLMLPAVPRGQFNDVDQDSQAEQGLQVFAVAYSPNLTGDVFSAGDDRSLGWPGYLASVRTDSENQNEVTGGRLVVWAADDSQQFPSGFGSDGLLFTSDDPQMNMPSGYSVVNLDSRPFRLLREREVEIELYEPQDIAIKDFSSLDYSEAFERMFAIIEKEYAFNGIAGKQPDWQALYDQIAPRIAAAEQEQDANAYLLALHDLSLAFQDGHVSVNSAELQNQSTNEPILGGYGFAVRELDDGNLMVVYVLPGGPADKAGMRVGAQLLEFNGEDVHSALEKVAPFQPQSTTFGKRYEQTVFLTRAPIDEKTRIAFINPIEPLDQIGYFRWIFEAIRYFFQSLFNGRHVRLTSVYEVDSLFAVYGGGSNYAYGLPVEYQFDESTQIGVIRMLSNYDNLGLAVRIFERALKIFEQAGAVGLVIDMRHNSGGASLGLAGYLYDQEIPMGQLEYYSEKSGQFEADGPREKVLPNENQYRFDKMVLLVDQFCYSACEIEAYGFSQVPGMLVMGQFPTAGVEAEIARGKFHLPEGIEFNIPTGRYKLPDGSIFLEGEGVQLDIQLPVNRESLLSGQDAVLQAAYDYILNQ